MKWTSITLDLSRVGKIVRSARSISKTFLTMIGCTMLFFALLGLAGYVKAKDNSSPISSMKGIAASVSNDFFLDMLGMEVPHLNQDKQSTTFSQKNVFSFLFRLVTDINPHDPKTLLAREVPGLGDDEATLLRKGSGTDLSDSPSDYSSTSSAGKPNSGKDTNPAGTAPSPSPSPSPSPEPTAQPGKLTTGGRKVVMIYHSHNRESYFPEISGKDPFDDKKNVTLVGKRLADQLESKGIGAVHYDTDYQKVVKDFNYYYSYKYSGKTVKEAMAANPDIKFLFDIHRDDGPRSRTTVTIDGKDYAQVFFIIGKKNPNWEKNEKFASQLQADLDKKMPGLTKGIWGKSAAEGDAEYNQSVSPDSVLIEIGGPYNTLEECYRTADVLASAISDLYWNATKASAPADGAKS